METASLVIVVLSAFMTGGIVGVSFYLYQTGRYKNHLSIHSVEDREAETVVIAFASSSESEGEGLWSNILNADRYVVSDLSRTDFAQPQLGHEEEKKLVGDEQMVVTPARREVDRKLPS